MAHRKQNFSFKHRHLAKQECTPVLLYCCAAVLWCSGGGCKGEGGRLGRLVEKVRCRTLVDQVIGHAHGGDLQNMNDKILYIYSTFASASWIPSIRAIALLAISI
jgi:hypothetical protein